MAGAREALQPEHDVSDDVDVLGRHRHELTPEHVERVAVEPPRARLEPARLDEMRRADRGDVHLQRGVRAHEGAGRAGMVEVDVGEEQVRHVPELEPAVGEAGLEVRDARGRPAVEQRDAVVRLDEVAAHVVREAAVQEVDGLRE